MSWGLILSALTIGVSLVTEKDAKSPARTSSSSSSSALISQSDKLFLAGALLGSGLSFLTVTLSRQFRISERLKMVWLNLWSNAVDRPFRKPAPLLPEKDNDGQGVVLQQNKDGSIRVLISPKCAATNNLTVTLLVLEPGSELPSRRTRAMEFYHVLGGTGSFSQQGIVETLSIKKGDCFVVEPGHLRWISNRNGVEELVLMRASDDTSDNAAGDFIRLDSQRRPSILEYGVDTIKGSFRAMEGYIKDVVTNGNSSS